MHALILALVISSPADDLARAVVEAAGDPYAEDVLRFTFVVRDGDVERLLRAHVWCPKKDVVEVTTAGRSVRISLDDRRALDGTSSAEDAKKAYAAFINDGYWLLAPSKLMDEGVRRRMTESGELAISFDGVGLTPGDVYRFTVEEDGRVSRWSFVLQGGGRGAFSWEDYRKVGGLDLAQTHRAEGSDRVIALKNLSAAGACPY